MEVVVNVSLEDAIREEAPYHLRAGMLALLQGWKERENALFDSAQTNGFDAACRILANDLDQRDLADRLYQLKSKYLRRAAA